MALHLGLGRRGCHAREIGTFYELRDLYLVEIKQTSRCYPQIVPRLCLTNRTLLTEPVTEVTARHESGGTKKEVRRAKPSCKPWDHIGTCNKIPSRHRNICSSHQVAFEARYQFLTKAPLGNNSPKTHNKCYYLLPFPFTRVKPSP